MTELYFWPSPNGYKLLIQRQEPAVSYGLRPVNIVRQSVREDQQIHVKLGESPLQQGEA